MPGARHQFSHFYKWRSKFGSMDASLMARFKELEDENLLLKKMYAEERLKAKTVQEALQKSGETILPTRDGTTNRRERRQHTAGCLAFGIILSPRNVKGYRWNHKRVYQIYRALELNLRIKPKKRIVREKPEPLAVPETINQCWSIDFMYDQLSDGRSYRLFHVINDFNREALAIDIDLSLPAERVVRALDQIIEWSGKPQILRSDNGPASISGTFIAWAERRGIRLDHIQPGNPQQNAYIERDNRTVRYDWLSHYLFGSIEEVRNYATHWV